MLHATPAAAAPARLDSLGAAARAGWSDQPRFVMLRSAVIPGWGQWHNGAVLKAAVAAGAEGYLAARLLADSRELSRLDAAAARERREGSDQSYADAVTRYNARLDTFIRRQWLLAGALTIALLDAYVDAHFKGFDVEFKEDPALPDGVPEAARSRSRRRAPLEARLSYRWNF